jgi:phospholipid transport system transporter-binding protein
MKKAQAPIKVSLEQVDVGRFKVTGALNFDTVPMVWQQSQQLFSGCNSLAIDFSEVTHSNSAGLALLTEWMRVARANNQSIVFQHIPAQMQEIARVCGVEQDLPLG